MMETVVNRPLWKGRQEKCHKETQARKGPKEWQKNPLSIHVQQSEYLGTGEERLQDQKIKAVPLPLSTPPLLLQLCQWQEGIALPRPGLPPGTGMASCFMYFPVALLASNRDSAAVFKRVLMHMTHWAGRRAFFSQYWCLRRRGSKP